MKEKLKLQSGLKVNIVQESRNRKRKQHSYVDIEKHGSEEKKHSSIIPHHNSWELLGFDAYNIALSNSVEFDGEI